MRSKSGNIIVKETATGKILASASWPGYDPNRVLELAADPETAKWLKDPSVSDMYEPGSVMKLCTISAAIDAGVVTPDSVFQDPGKIIVEGKTIRNSDLAAHGNVDLTTTLAKSLNVVTVQVAPKLGAEQFYRGMQAFGIGNRTGIDLGGEAPGAAHAQRRSLVQDRPGHQQFWARHGHHAVSSDQRSQRHRQ